MKRILLILGVLLVVAARSFAGPTVVVAPPLAPRTPEIMAQGDSFTANANGFDSLFTNPASFSAQKPSFTVLTLNPWLYALPTSNMLKGISSILGNPVQGLTLLNSLLTGDGTGVGFFTGLGYVGGGLGVGGLLTTNTFGYGTNVFGVSVNSNVTAALIGGASLPFQVGPVTLTPGVDVRPMYRLSLRNLTVADLTGLLSGGSLSSVGVDALFGPAIAFDAAVNAVMGPFTGAISVRDIGNTRFFYSSNSLANTANALRSGKLPSGTPVDPSVTKYVIPMSIHLGFAYHPNLGPLAKLVDPTVHAEYVVYNNAGLNQVAWNNVHLGADLLVLKLINVRAGINQGYITFGAGVKARFAQVNVAYFNRELGRFPGAHPSQGLTADVAVQF